MKRSTKAQQIRDQAGQLNVGLFQKRLQLILQPHSVARQLVLSPRHRPPQTLLGIGHKAQSQFPGHQPFHQAFGIGKILLAPPRSAVRLHLSRMQRSGPPPCAFSLLARSGFQYLSSAPHTGFQYWAVDSRTTSSASCSSSHAASDRSCSGLLSNIRRSNWYSLSISTSDTTTASIFLWTSIPAIRYDIDSSWPVAES